MSEQPILSGEFNAAMDGLRGILSRVEKTLDSTNARIDDLATLHRECTARRETRAFHDGVERGKVATLVADVAEIKGDQKSARVFRRGLAASIAVSLLTSVLAMFTAFIKQK